MINVSPELAKIADEINALSPAAQVRLAADLIEKQRFDTALILLERIVAELTLVTMTRRRAGLTGGAEGAPR